MKLRAVTVQKFRNFAAPQRVEIEEDLTALVGLNDAGKTALMEAMYHLKPGVHTDLSDSQRDLDPEHDYPRWLLEEDRAAGIIDSVRPVVAEFVPSPPRLEDQSLAPLVAPLLPSSVLYAARDYANRKFMWVRTPWPDVVRLAASETGANEADIEALAASADRDSAVAYAQTKPGLAGFEEALSKYRYLLDGEYELEAEYELEEEEEFVAALWEWVPYVNYAYNYTGLPGMLNLDVIVDWKEGRGRLEDSHEILYELMGRAGAWVEDLARREDQEDALAARKALLADMAEPLNTAIAQYWRPNPNLEVVFEREQYLMADFDGEPRDVPLLWTSVRDARRPADTNLFAHSTGFNWFLSFVARYSQYENMPEDTVLLFDNLTVGLHPDAQEGFAAYLLERVAASQQVIYATHSEHMLPPGAPDKVRTVRDEVAGAVVESGRGD